MKKTKILLIAAAAFVALGGSSAHATSVSTGEGVKALVTQVAAPIAAAQAAAIVAGNVASAVGGAVSGAIRTSSAPTNYFNLRDIAKGKSAQGAALRVGAWLSGGYTSIDANDRGGEFDGRVYNINGGLDYKFTERLLAGVTVGYENLDIDTTFNRGTFEGDGVSAGPYFGYRLSDNWAVSGLVTYTWLSYDVRNGNTAVTGSFDAERLSANLGLNGGYKVNNWVIGPQAGVLFMQEDQDRYNDSAGTRVNGDVIPLVRWSAGGTLGYNFGNVTPYVKALGEYDSTHSAAVDLGNGTKSSNDRFGAVAGGGVNVAMGRAASANIEATHNTLGRENLDVWTVKGRVSVNF